VKKSTELIPKVKESFSRNPAEMIPKYKKFTRINSEGENQSRQIPPK
jgi:hypothetical protein